MHTQLYSVVFFVIAAIMPITKCVSTTRLVILVWCSSTARCCAFATYWRKACTCRYSTAEGKSDQSCPGALIPPRIVRASPDLKSHLWLNGPSPTRASLKWARRRLTHWTPPLNSSLSTIVSIRANVNSVIFGHCHPVTSFYVLNAKVWAFISKCYAIWDCLSS